MIPSDRTSFLRSLAADPQVPQAAFDAFGRSLAKKINFADARALLEQTVLSRAQFSAAAAYYAEKGWSVE